MWQRNGLPRFFVAICVLGLLPLLLPARIDLAAEGPRASGADKAKGASDPCEKPPKSGRADRGDADEEPDANGAADVSEISDNNDGAEDGDAKDKKKGKRLRDCEPPSSGGVARGDFNGDGIADLAVGVPFEDEDLVGSVGAVNIIYGSTTGLTSTGDQYLTEVTFGYPYTFDDRFGAALASGDFNGDGFSDLAIGMPRRERFGNTDHGVVLLIDGSANGLVTSTARTLNLLNNRGGEAGAALVWADFNADGFGDLAVGIPGADFSSAFGVSLNAGAVQVFYGQPTGLTQTGAQEFGGFAGYGDRFGAPLAAGDFNGDGASDLAMGAPSGDIEDIPCGIIPSPGCAVATDGGYVLVAPGGLFGIQFGDRQYLDQEEPDVNGTAEDGDNFGFALAVGDFNADLRDDLAVGVPYEDLGTASDSGAVHVFLGGSPFAGELVDSVNDLFFDQENLGGGRESGDLFGRALAAGKFNDDFLADLAVGSPHEDVGSLTDAGLVSVVYGATSGLSFTSAQHWTQDSLGIPDSAEAGDEFGRALSAWNYGKSTHADLAIGVPFEDLLSVNTGTQQADAGAVVVIYGSATGLSATTANPSQFWHQDVSGIGSAASAGDRFGVTLY